MFNGQRPKTDWRKNRSTYYDNMNNRNVSSVGEGRSVGGPNLSNAFSLFHGKPLGNLWNKKSGIQPYNLGKASTALGVGYNLYNIGSGLNELSDSRGDGSDIASDIVTASYNNPMLQYDLDPEQLKMLRQLRRDSYDTEAGMGDIDWSDTIGGALKGGIYGLAGGIPGVILGALGGGANAAIDSMNTAQGVTNDELEALYAAIMQSEQEYNALRKQRMVQNGIF